MKTLATLILLAGSAFGQGILGPILTGVGGTTGGGGGGGGVAHIVDTDGHAVDNAVTSSVDTTGANFIVCSVSAYTAGPADSFSDSKSNTWSTLTSRSITTGSYRETIYYTVSPTVGSGHTFTNATTGSYSYITCSAFSGVKTTSTLVAQNGASDVTPSGASAQFGSVTPGTTGDLAISFMGWPFGASSATATINSSFTKGNCYLTNSGVTEGGCIAWLITTSTTALNPTWTLSISNTTAGTNAIFAKQ